MAAAEAQVSEDKRSGVDKLANRILISEDRIE